jgi:hypothetical protein
MRLARVLTLAVMVLGVASAAARAEPQLVVSDPLNSEETGWPVGSENFGLAKMSIQPDGYHIETIRKYGHLAINPTYMDTYGTLTDTRAEIDVGKAAGGDDNAIGLVCRLSPTTGYWLWAGTDGTAGIERVRVLSGRTTIVAPIMNWDVTPLVNSSAPAPQQGYHLTAECMGTTLRLLVDSTQVAEYETESVESGYFGMAVVTNEAEGGDFLFSNLVLSQL